MKSRLRLKNPDQNKNLVRLKNELISLIWKGKYNPGSKIHNKILYLFLHRYVLIRTGTPISNNMKYLSRIIGYQDFMSDIDLCILECINKYNPKIANGISLMGYVIATIPYRIKKLIDSYESQIGNVSYTWKFWDWPDDRYYGDRLAMDLDWIIGDKDSMARTFMFLKYCAGIKYKDSAEAFLLNAASIRRKVMKLT